MEERWVGLREQVLQRLDLSGSTTNEELLETIERTVFEHSETEYIPNAEKQAAIFRIFHSFRGLDILQPLIENPKVTEIMVNSHEEIFFEQAGQISRYPVTFESREKLEDLIQTIVGQVNRMVNESSPIVDARLKDGSRVNVVLPPIALKGPTMTIRKFPVDPLSMNQLVEQATLTEEVSRLLEKLVVAKFNIFISGGTGSGKTTLLNALTQYIPKDERIITIEDSAELRINSISNLVSMETRNANTEGRGGVTMRELIRTSLRMRPNRIIVGEVRGAEALDMLQAMNTGHDGSLSTGHANSVNDMLSRLETMVLSGAKLPVQVIRKQIGSAIDIMIHLSRMRDRSRKIIEISEISGMKEGEIILNPLYLFKDEGDSADGRVKGRLEATGNRLYHAYKLELAGMPR